MRTIHRCACDSELKVICPAKQAAVNYLLNIVTYLCERFVTHNPVYILVGVKTVPVI